MPAFAYCVITTDVIFRNSRLYGSSMRKFVESDDIGSDIRRLEGLILPDIESSTAVEQCVDNEIAIMSYGSSLLLIHNNLNVEKKLCVSKDFLLSWTV